MNGPLEYLMRSEITIRFDYTCVYMCVCGSAFFPRWKKGIYTIFQTRNTCIFVQARVAVLLGYNACFANNLRMVIEQKESIYEYRALCKSSGNYVDVEHR